MSRAAAGNWQSAIRENTASRRNVPPAKPQTKLFLPIAYCQLPIADVASCCTVTFPLTSVTQLGLARSVLIEVGKPDLEGLSGLSAPWMLGSEALRCSFGDSTCIQ